LDIEFFFNERISFIRQLYETSSNPYKERKRLIEAEEEPYIPPYSEDGEPAFLNEWLEADESLHILAYSCISMLAATLQLYFESWVTQSRRSIDNALKKGVFKKKGWLAGYMAHFTQHFSICFENSETDYSLLEEVILARNRIQHPSSIIDLKTHFNVSDLKKIETPLFLSDMAQDEYRFFPPTLHISEEQLNKAISEVEQFVKWFEPEIEKKVFA